MKKLLCLALALMMALTLFGCRAETAATEAPAEDCLLYTSDAADEL